MILALRLPASAPSLPSGISGPPSWCGRWADREGDVEEEEAKEEEEEEAKEEEEEEAKDRVGKKGEGCFPPKEAPEDAETTA